ncbi:hypothetical protein QYE76_023769 [Lolium multiflorum]|uniref:Gag-pol polyprotein n=1 Tax=Lolium multiflorum TaxID=4521 RepID=A0AAD8RDK3_LOLMU|nr:hypothetical protein QYE76_023769 [Lolium multiflorum]
MGKPRDTKIAILPSTTRKGTTLSTSAALDSPSVISKLVSPPQASNVGTSAESENSSHNCDDASAVLDNDGSLGSFLDATIAKSRQIENTETPNENAATPVNSPESVEYSSDDLDEDYVELDDDFIEKCNATTDARKIKKLLAEHAVRYKLSPDPKFATSPINIRDKDYDFSLDLSHIAIVEKTPFCGTEKESVVEHMTELSTLSGLFSDDIKMRTYFVAKFFPFSLKDDAKTWYNNLPPGSIKSPKELLDVFFRKYFPASAQHAALQRIYNFDQEDGEKLPEAWARFCSLIRAQPDHDLEKHDLLDIFYSGLTIESRAYLDSCAGCVFRKRTPDDAEELLAKIGRNHDDWSTPEPTPTPIVKKRGMIKLNDEDMREAKKSLKEKGIKPEDVKNLPPIEDLCEITPPSSMIEDPLYPEGHPKRVEQDSQLIKTSAPSKKKKKKHKNVVESSEPVNDPNSISISDAETESGNEHDKDNDKDDTPDKEEIEKEPEKPTKNKKYTKEDFITEKHDMASPINFNQFLEKEKLKSNGSNFTDWFRHVRIFLNGGNLQYVLDAPLGDPPAETETDEVKNVYATRKTRYSQVQCAILCSLESDLQKRFEHHDPHELMKELKTIFETHAAVECYEASKHFFSCMMEEGSSISEHMLVMTGHAKKLSDLGIVIPNRLGINRVLQSLPPSYKNFVMNYNMQNMNKEFPELFGMLKAAEIEIKKEHQVLMVNKTTSFKKQGKSKGKFKKGGKKAATPPMKPKNGPKPDADCYYCKEKGHWKRNCSKYLADLKSGLVKKKKEGISDIHVIDVHFTGSRSSTWVFDTGSVAHICNSKQELKNKRQLLKDEVTMRVGNGSKVNVIAVGTLPLHLPSGLVLSLNNCYYVPALSMNIISGSCLMQDGYSFKSENNGCSIFMNNIFYGRAPEKNGLFLLDLDSSDTHIHNIDAKRIKLNDNSTYMWHCRLGHIGVKRMKKLHTDGLLESLDFESLDRCEACLMGKMTKTPFSGMMERATDLLEIIHTDVCGPMSVASRGGYRYVLTFTDDLSRYGYIYLMKHKSETFEKFKEFQSEVENQRNKKIKFLRSDRGGEYLSYEFGMHLKKCGILSQLTPPGTPQRNGVSERRNRTLLDMVRSMMSLTDLPLSFWSYALETAAFTLNRAPSKSVETTPYELWFNKKPKLSFLKVWGCEAYVKKLQPDKLEPKAEKCVFIGYPKETIGYTFYHRSEGKIFVAKNGTFLEKEFLTKEVTGRKVELDEIEESLLVDQSSAVPENVPVPPTPTTEEANDNDHETSNETATEPRRSTRDRATPDWYDPCLNVMIVDNNDEDPATYEEAMMSPDSNKWQEAMKSEMGSMYDNKVWTLVDLPDSRKAVENKWIFKRKTDADGNITVYKARLVAKGFRQIQGVDYDETFSPVAKLKSVRILLAIAAFFDYEIWQMDVKTAFLNGDIEEELYMVQPKGFVDPKNADKVCKLQRSIYGLKQASRSWNRRFDKVIKDFGFIQCHGEACIYKKVSGSSVAFLILYVDDILLIGNDIELLSSVKEYIPGQDSKKFRMDESKKGFLPMLPGKVLSKTQGPATAEERERMSQIPYASAVGSIMYAMLCTRPDIAHAVSLTSRYQSDPGMEHWTAVKNILKYLKRTKDMFLCYGGDQELVVTSYTDASWNTDPDDSKSQSGYVFILNGAAVSWASSKQCTVAKSSTESEYIAASEASSEAVWMKRFIVELGVVPSALDPFVIYCDNMGAIANAQEPRSHKRLKHIKLRYHSIREYIEDGEVKICKVHTDLNVADPLTKALPRAKHDQHQNAMGVRVTHLKLDVEMVELEYGMEFEYLFGVPDVIPDITRSSGMVRRIRFIYRMSFYVNKMMRKVLWKVLEGTTSTGRPSRASTQIRRSYNEDVIAPSFAPEEDNGAPNASSFPCYDFLTNAGILDDFFTLVNRAGLATYVGDEREQYYMLTKIFVESFKFHNTQYEPTVAFKIYDIPVTMELEEFCRALDIAPVGTARRIDDNPRDLLELYRGITEDDCRTIQRGKIRNIQLPAIKYFAYYIATSILGRENTSNISSYHLAFLNAALTGETSYHLGSLIARRLSSRGPIFGGTIALRILTHLRLPLDSNDVPLTPRRLDIAAMKSHHFVTTDSTIDNMVYRMLFADGNEKEIPLPQPGLFSIDRQSWSLTKEEVEEHMKIQEFHQQHDSENAEPSYDCTVTYPDVSSSTYLEPGRSSSYYGDTTSWGPWE